MSRITVARLREALEDLDDDLEVPPRRSARSAPSATRRWTRNTINAWPETGPMANPDYDHDFATREDAGVVYLVANGHPDRGSPYGDRDAWSDMERI